MIKWIVAIWLGHAADILTTVYGLSRGCVELNPIYQLGGMSTLLAVKVVAVSVVSLMVWRTAQLGEVSNAKVMAGIFVSVGVGAAVWNCFQFPRC